MHKTLLTSAALLGLAMAAPAYAQNYATEPETAPAPNPRARAPQIPSPQHMMRAGAMNPETGARPGHVPGVGVSLPLSGRASNIMPSNTHSIIAPTLPTPSVPTNAGAQDFLNAAKTALAQHRTGEAQEAMERAETRRLDRDAAQGIAPSSDPLIGHIRAARQALATHNLNTAEQEIAGAQTMASNEPAEQNAEGANPNATGSAVGGGTTMATPPAGAEAGQPYYNTTTSGMYSNPTGQPFRTAQPGTLGAEVNPPGTPMNPTGSPTGEQ
jgi:hypothetical protein